MADSETPSLANKNNKSLVNNNNESLVNKNNESLVNQAGPLANKGNRTFKLMGQIVNMGGDNSISSGLVLNNQNGNLMSMYQSYGNKDEPQMKSLANVIRGDNELIKQSSVQVSELVSLKNLAKSSAGSIAKKRRNIGSKTNGSTNNGEAKSYRQEYSHNFPTNVRVLLSTGILDGVPVAYVSWKRDISLRAVIELSGYKCSCKECKNTKIITAYELERHAGYSTKLPNKSIYLANGKSLYGIVQELRSTLPEKLFETLETITSSPVNQRNFSVWKDSFIATNQEFQRILEKGKTIMPSKNKDLVSPKV